jgi:hypothetical protein
LIEFIEGDGTVRTTAAGNRTATVLRKSGIRDEAHKLLDSQG